MEASSTAWWARNGVGHTVSATGLARDLTGRSASIPVWMLPVWTAPIMTTGLPRWSTGIHGAGGAWRKTTIVVTSSGAAAANCR
ncbi:Uncharacterised protein [Mycobacterium tuberculosis]|nr:Uncharacterised protein [Mycobacterium tuberculosis]